MPSRLSPCPSPSPALLRAPVTRPAGVTNAPQSSYDGSVAASQTGRTLAERATRAQPWDICLAKGPGKPLVRVMTVWAVSQRAALYQWKKGNAAPPGSIVRVHPGLSLF